VKNSLGVRLEEEVAGVILPCFYTNAAYHVRIDKEGFRKKSVERETAQLALFVDRETKTDLRTAEEINDETDAYNNYVLLARCT